MPPPASLPFSAPARADEADPPAGLPSPSGALGGAPASANLEFSTTHTKQEGSRWNYRLAAQKVFGLCSFASCGIIWLLAFTQPHAFVAALGLFKLAKLNMSVFAVFGMVFGGYLVWAGEQEIPERTSRVGRKPFACAALSMWWFNSQVLYMVFHMAFLPPVLSGFLAVCAVGGMILSMPILLYGSDSFV